MWQETDSWAVGPEAYIVWRAIFFRRKYTNLQLQEDGDFYNEQKNCFKYILNFDIYTTTQKSKNIPVSFISWQLAL